MMGEKSEVKRRRPTKRMDKTLVNRYWASVEPTSREELAVHPKKLEEIDHWIERNAIRKQSRPAPILLLVGPTGSGKTASVRVISKEKKVEVQEWTNQLPDANQFGTDK